MSKVEGGGVRLTPPPSRLRVTIFSRRLLGLNGKSVIITKHVTLCLITTQLYQLSSCLVLVFMSTFFLQKLPSCSVG